MDRLRFAFLLTLMWSAAILAAFVAVFLTVTGPANAQSIPCKPWDVAKVELEKAGFHKVGIGMISENLVVTIMETEGGAEWALITIDSTGKSCLFQTGANWVPFEEPKLPVPGERPA